MKSQMRFTAFLRNSNQILVASFALPGGSNGDPCFGFESMFRSIRGNLFREVSGVPHSPSHW